METEFFTAHGLWHLWQESRKRQEEIERSLAKILDAKDDGGGYFGHLSDTLCNGDTFGRYLRKVKHPMLEQLKEFGFTII